jgi:hypothetical protein
MKEVDKKYAGLIEQACQLLVKREADAIEEPKVKTEDDAKGLIKQKMMKSYDNKVKVSFSKTEMETNA